MADIRAVDRFGNDRPVSLDIDGRLYTVEGSRPYIYSYTGAAAISLATTVGTDFPGRAAKLSRIAMTFSTAPTTSESITLTASVYNARRPASVIFSYNPSLDAATSVVKYLDHVLVPGDEVTLAYTNTDTRTVKCEIAVEVL